MFGGKGPDGKATNDMLLLKTNEFKMERIETSGPIPGKRRYHSSAVINEKLYIYGGLGKGVSDEIHCLDTNSREWLSITTKGDVPKTRWFTSSFFNFSDQLYLFGGQTVKGYKSCNDLNVFNIET